MLAAVGECTSYMVRIVDCCVQEVLFTVQMLRTGTRSLATIGIYLRAQGALHVISGGAWYARSPSSVLFVMGTRADTTAQSDHLFDTSALVHE
jgi:hypothetical protein